MYKHKNSESNYQPALLAKDQARFDINTIRTKYDFHWKIDRREWTYGVIE